MCGPYGEIDPWITKLDVSTNFRRPSVNSHEVIIQIEIDKVGPVKGRFTSLLTISSHVYNEACGCDPFLCSQCCLGSFC